MSLAEAERQERLARERLDVDVLRTCGHLSAAWDASDEAEDEGADPLALQALRLRLLQFSILEWLPRVSAEAAARRDPRERAEWYRGLSGAMNVAAHWHLSEIAAGRLVVENVEEARAGWVSQIETFAALARGAAAS